MREIMLVPLPRAASRRLMSFLTFHISICRVVSASAREIRGAIPCRARSTRG